MAVAEGGMLIGGAGWPVMLLLLLGMALLLWLGLILLLLLTVVLLVSAEVAPIQQWLGVAFR